MFAEQTINTQIDLLQHQRRRITLLVNPNDKRIAHHHFRLMQQPIGQIVTATLLGKCHTAYKYFSLYIPANQKLWAIDFQAGQTNLSSEQRQPR